MSHAQVYCEYMCVPRPVYGNGVKGMCIARDSELNVLYWH